MENSFDNFFQRRQEAAARYVSGDGSLLDAMVPHAGEASFHSPGGDSVSGAEDVASRYVKDAASFAQGSETRFEILQKGSSGDLGFWTGFQVARVRLASKDELVDMRIRVTEVFRRIDGVWVMVHRHADLGAPTKR